MRPLQQSVETKSSAVITFTESIYNGTVDQITPLTYFVLGAYQKRVNHSVTLFRLRECRVLKSTYAYALITNKVSKISSMDSNNYIG